MMRTNYLEKSFLQHRQRGLVLVMALIVLVAMTLAGIAMVRSVDTANIVAGNLAIRQSTTLSTEAGIQAGYTWLKNAQAVRLLDNDDIAAGYRSNIAAAEPDWLADATWAAAPQVGPDAAGNTVNYLMYRFCDTANTAPAHPDTNGMPNRCSTTLGNSASSNTDSGNNGDLTGDVPATPGVKYYYRVVARSKGPRNTTSVAMATIIFSR